MWTPLSPSLTPRPSGEPKHISNPTSSPREAAAAFASAVRLSLADSPAAAFAFACSAPHMHAYCLELLAGHLRPGAKCLDVGSGSGYLTSVFAHLVAGAGAQVKGKAVGIEHIPELHVSESLSLSLSLSLPLSLSY